MTHNYLCFRNSFLEKNRVELRACFNFPSLLWHGLNSWKGDENVRHVRLYFNWHIIWVLLCQLEKKGLKSNLLKVHDRELRTDNFPNYNFTANYLTHSIQYNLKFEPLDPISFKIIHSHHGIRKHIWTWIFVPTIFGRYIKPISTKKGADYTHQFGLFRPCLERFWHACFSRFHYQP